MIALYFVFCACCLIFFIFQNWYVGEDLQLSILMVMLFIAVVPIINVLVVLFMAGNMLMFMVNKSGTILKGRK